MSVLISPFQIAPGATAEWGILRASAAGVLYVFDFATGLFVADASPATPPTTPRSNCLLCRSFPALALGVLDTTAITMPDDYYIFPCIDQYGTYTINVSWVANKVIAPPSTLTMDSTQTAALADAIVAALGGVIHAIVDGFSPGVYAPFDPHTTAIFKGDPIRDPVTGIVECMDMGTSTPRVRAMPIGGPNAPGGYNLNHL